MRTFSVGPAAWLAEHFTIKSCPAPLFTAAIPAPLLEGGFRANAPSIILASSLVPPSIWCMSQTAGLVDDTVNLIEK